MITPARMSPPIDSNPAKSATGSAANPISEAKVEKGVEKVQISPEVIAEFRTKAADPIRDEWIADMESQGIPGQELYDLVMKTLEDAKSGS